MLKKLLIGLRKIMESFWMSFRFFEPFGETFFCANFISGALKTAPLYNTIIVKKEKTALEM